MSKRPSSRVDSAASEYHSLRITSTTQCAGIGAERCNVLAYERTTGTVNSGGFIRFQGAQWQDDRPKWRCERCVMGIFAQPRDQDERSGDNVGSTTTRDRRPWKRARK